jgi:quinohemoprotein ethanol dehydrogenase
MRTALRYGSLVASALALLAGCGGPERAGTEASASAQSATSVSSATTASIAASASTLGAASTRAFGRVDRERLLEADSEPQNWMTEGRDIGKTHFSPLADINLDTVGRLGSAWQYDTHTTRGLEATPVVVDGVLYAAGTTGRVYALDAATGAELWTFDPQSDGQVNRYACCDEVNRGLTVYDGLVYIGAFDGRLFALDAATGKVVWQVDTFIYKDRAYSSSGAPEIAGDVVVIGNAGADYDARGYVSAYDRKTGEFKWRFFTVPGDPAKGFEHPELDMAAKTWDPHSRWDVGGGGTVWNAMVYDPELNLLYVGTGNAALFNWHERSPSGGDNLFLCSILAINPDTGRLVWYYQEVPRESWDYTATQPMILADLELDGETHKVLMQAPKSGFFYILDRETGKLLSTDKYVPVNWASHVDLETGRPAINEDLVDYTKGPVFVVPSGMGGHAWNPMAFDPRTGIVYIPAIEGGAITYDPTDGHVYRPKQANSGNSTLFGDSLLMDPERAAEPMRPLLRKIQASGEAKSRAALKAFDPKTGKVLWEQEGSGWWDRGGVLATAGDLVFQGTDTGHLRAYDSKTGEIVKDIEVGTSIIAAPMTYAVDGVQYVAVMAAWGGGGWFAPHDTSAVVKYGNEGRILAFKLDGGETPLPPPVSEIGPIPKPPEQTANAETIREGAQLFARSCSLCHANVAYGLTPDLRRMPPEIHAAFKAIVLQGALRSRGMPQWDDVLDDAQADAIHAYLIDLAQHAYDAQQQAKGD